MTSRLFLSIAKYGSLTFSALTGIGIAMLGALT